MVYGNTYRILFQPPPSGSNVMYCRWLLNFCLRGDTYKESLGISLQYTISWANSSDGPPCFVHDKDAISDLIVVVVDDWTGFCGRCNSSAVCLSGTSLLGIGIVGNPNVSRIWFWIEGTVVPSSSLAAAAAADDFAVLIVEVLVVVLEIPRLNSFMAWLTAAL